MINTSIDDVAGYLPKINIPKQKRQNKTYVQKMQSLYGSRQFILTTEPNGKGGFLIKLREKEAMSLYDKLIGTRTANNDEADIERAIKSLERKARCKLYYVLLISTDGDYL